MFSNKLVSVYLIIILLFSLLLLNLPLAGVLGYEYSALTSLLLVILSGLYSVSAIKKTDFETISRKKFYKQLINTYALFLSIPFLVGVINSFFGLSCSLIHGILFYIFIAYPAVIIGASLGVISFSVTKRFPVLLFMLLLIIIAAIPVAEIYFYPQIYFYNPLVGFFPGTIYDEGLSVNFRLIIYRVINIIFFGTIFLLLIKSFFKQTSFRRRNIVWSALIIPAVFVFVSSFFGYSTPGWRMKSELSGKVETPHFIIHYSRDIDTNMVKVSALHHEYYYKELTSFFKLKPKEKITSYVFSSSEQKGILFGSENADVAKPWLRQIYTTYDNYNTSLKHEIAHVFSGEFSPGIFKIAGGFNPALIEGIATAAHPVYGENNIHFLAAIANRYGYKVSIQNLFSSFNFFGSVSSLSYVYAGSFSSYLIDTYGIGKFKKLYLDPDFNKVYKKPIKTLEKDYFLFLKTINVKGEEHTAHYYFGRKSIFQKVCPRYIADRTDEASGYFYNNQFEEAAEIFQELYRLSGSYSPLAGWVNSLIELNRTAEADSIIRVNIESFHNTAYYYNLELSLADISARRGYYSVADSLYNKILFQNPGRTLFYLANTRRDLLAWNDLIGKYLDGSELDKYIILREINNVRYYYNTFPVLVDLSRLLKEDYSIFLRQFRHTIIVNSYSASYGALKLSEYALENMDIEVARRMAALSLRYNAEENYNFILKENFVKVNWFRDNALKLLTEMKFNE